MIPKISIVLPNYNYARYLDERIQSLLNQTYTDFELIILDDASQDNSIEVIEKYTADPRVKTKYFSENSGLTYKRWNDGADIAQGEYLLIALIVCLLLLLLKIKFFVCMVVYHLI